MTRYAELFAIAAIVLLVFGLAFPRISALNNVSLSLYSNRDFSYEVSPRVILFAVAALFGCFACVYSLPLVHMNRSAATCHFWLSGVSIVLFGVGLIATAAAMPLSPPTVPRSGPSTTAIASIFSALLFAPAVFLGGQIVFLINLLLGIFRGSHTP